LSLVYKVLLEDEWQEAKRVGVFHGAAVDQRDGYIHLSTGQQVEKTVELYFAQRDDLILLALDSEGWGESLKWEPSRGGALFPHLYAPFAIERVLSARRFSAGDPNALRSLLADS
jgi:uncharacterized protein (DUF952 family)